jgi:hypothetical protein
MVDQPVDASFSKRLARRVVGPLVAGIAVVVGTFAVGEQTSWRFTGWGADPSGHYSLAYWFARHWTMPAPEDLTWGITAHNPPAANIAAALVGHIVGSTFMGMYLVASAAVVLVWCALAALVALLPEPRRWIALGALTLTLAFNTSAGPLRLNVHGFEIVLNYFLAQIAAQAVVWWLVWFSVVHTLRGRSFLSTALPIAIVAVLSTYVHGVGSVELLALLGCLATAETVARWRDGKRKLSALAPPFGLFLTTGVAISVMPPFRAQRGFAANDGYLKVDYVSWPVEHVAVALATVVLSTILLVLSTRAWLDRATGIVFRGLAFAGISIAAPFFAQLALLAAGEGSPYAVKKYAFGLITVLLVDLCVLVASLVPLSGRLSTAQTALTYVLGVALVLVATYGVFSQPVHGSFTSQMVDLERRVETVVASGELGDDRRDYAVGLVDSDTWLDYVFTSAILRPRDRRPLDRHYLGKDRLLLRSADQLVTAVGTPYDKAACRTAGPYDGLVIVNAACLAGSST